MGRKRKFIAEQEKLIAQRYRSGLSSIVLGRELGVSHSLILDILRRQGLAARDQTMYRKYSLRDSVFDVLDNESSMYWFGFLYADGYVRSDGLAVRLKEEDFGHLEKFKTFLHSDSFLHRHKSRNGNTVRLTVHSKHLVNRLMEMGVIPNRGKFFLALRVLNKTLIRHFVRGLVDGDGYITREEVDFSPNLGFCERLDAVSWFRDIVLTYTDIKSRARIRRRTHTTNSYEIAFGGRWQVQKIVRWLYQDATVFLERKKERADYWGQIA